MEIRPAVLDDCDAVITLWRDAGLTRPWNDPQRDFQRKLRVQPELFLVADDAGVVGTVLAGYDGHRGWIHYLVVAAGHRNTGLGRTLLAQAEQRLAALGCPKVQLQVRRDNEGVLAFYEHLGYTPYEAHSLGKRLVNDA